VSGEKNEFNPRQVISRWLEPVFGFAGVVLLAVVLLFVVKGWVPRERPHPGPAEMGVLAVMPFDDLRASDGRGFSVEELARTLAAEFGRVVRVVPVERSFTYTGSNETLRDIARELGADSLLVASIVPRKAGARVRGRLIFAANSRELWAIRADGSDAASLAETIREQVLGRALDAGVGVVEEELSRGD